MLGQLTEVLAAAAHRGIDESQNLRNGLWLNGRANRTVADFYMILEYTEHEFGGVKGISVTLALSVNSQNKLIRSANNLSPLSGGRHTQEEGPGTVATLEEQQVLVAKFLRLWISLYKSGEGRA